MPVCYASIKAHAFVNERKNFYCEFTSKRPIPCKDISKTLQELKTSAELRPLCHDAQRVMVKITSIIIAPEQSQPTVRKDTKVIHTSSFGAAIDEFNQQTQ